MVKRSEDENLKFSDSEAVQKVELGATEHNFQFSSESLPSTMMS
jgi:hypothetical protein